MAAVSVSTTPVTLDAGTAAELLIRNTGSARALLTNPSGYLRAGQSLRVQPGGQPVTATSVSGTTLDVTVIGPPFTPGGGSSYSPIETVNTVSTSGAALTLPDVTTATIHDITLTANCAVTFPSLAAGKSFTVRLTQDATGSRTVTWPATVRWPGGVAPVLSTGAGKQDILSFVSVGGSAWSGFVAGQDLR